MIRFTAIAFIAAGLSLPSNGFAATLEEMSGTSFASTTTQQRSQAAMPLFSLALRAGLLGLGVIAVRRVAPFTK